MRKAVFALVLVVVSRLVETGAPAAAPPIHRAVIQVSGAEMCSGVFVAPYVLVTAAHCVVAPSGKAVGVSFGVRYSVSASIPGCWAAAQLMSCDWAVVRFAGPPAPMVHALSPDRAPVGSPLTLVGFPWNGFGAQQSLSGTLYLYLDGYQDEMFYTNPGIQGFSGGPLLAPDGLVRGVHGYLVAPWILPDPSGAGAATTTEMLQDVAAIPVGVYLALPFTPAHAPPPTGR